MTELFLKTMNERVKAVRKSMGLSQREVAEVLGVTVQSVSDIERANNGLSMKLFALLVEKYQINAYYLLFGKEPMFAAFDASGKTEIQVLPDIDPVIHPDSPLADERGDLALKEEIEELKAMVRQFEWATFQVGQRVLEHEIQLNPNKVDLRAKFGFSPEAQAKFGFSPEAQAKLGGGSKLREKFSLGEDSHNSMMHLAEIFAAMDRNAAVDDGEV